MKNSDFMQPEWSERCQIKGDHSQERELRRFSSRSRQQHHIEGLSGCWGYQGSGLVYLLPWLALGKWLHLGSKTTFGFGAFDWQVGMTS